MPRVSRTAISALVVAGVLLAGCSGGSHNASNGANGANGSNGSTAAAGSDQVEQLLATGVSQAEAKQFAEAETTFQDVLTLDPANADAWYNLGLIAQTQNDPSKAIADYQEAIKANPRDTSAMYNEAIALESTNRLQALALYKQIVNINPQAATAYLRMSFLYDDLGDRVAAAAAHAKATALEPALGSVTPPTT